MDFMKWLRFSGTEKLYLHVKLVTALHFNVQPWVCCLVSVCLLFAKQMWMIIVHLGGFNGAALMESFSCTTLHFITYVCQLCLIYKVSEGQRMWSINLWVGDCAGERGDGRIYHSAAWQDVLQLSLVKLEWVISVITLLAKDPSQE